MIDDTISALSCENSKVNSELGTHRKKEWLNSPKRKPSNSTKRFNSRAHEHLINRKLILVNIVNSLVFLL